MIRMHISENPVVGMGISETAPVDMVLLTPVVEGGDYPIYQGTYEVTPTQQEQTLLTAGMALEQNIKINPIPQNYGLITYNGFEITVS